MIVVVVVVVFVVEAVVVVVEVSLEKNSFSSPVGLFIDAVSDILPMLYLGCEKFISSCIFCQSDVRTFPAVKYADLYIFLKGSKIFITSKDL